MYWRSSRLDCLVAVVVVALLGSAVGVWAQGMMPMAEAVPSIGTPNLPCAEPQPDGSILVWGEARIWEGDNWTFALGGRANVGEDQDMEVTLFRLDTRGDDPIAGSVRDSEATLLGVNYKWVANRTDRMTISVIPGAEFPLDDMKGTNTDSAASAISDDVIPVFSLPVEFLTEGGTIVRIVPRYVGFDDRPRLGDGTTIQGFGDVLAVGVGALHEINEFSVMGDVVLILDGSNSIDKNTNLPTDEVVWSAGGSWHGENSPVRVDLFATNAAGPTGASSIIATPDQSVGFGFRVSGEY